jgi:phosphatidylglycerophosphatase A
MAKLKRFCITLIVTAFGSGFSPKAPGTAGSLVALFLVFAIRDWSLAAFATLWCVLFLIGWWATLEWSKAHQAKDSQAIVIDEVLGYMIATSLVPKTAVVLWIQFFLFRIFDALKPPPIRQLDQWGKRFPIGKMQSLGVILDDLLAGTIALVIFLLAKPYWSAFLD